MKTKVLDFLKQLPESPTEQFNRAMALAVESRMGENVLRRYNRRGYTKDNLAGILYDLQKFHDIKNVEISQHVIAEVEVVPAVAPPAVDGIAITDEDKDLFAQFVDEMKAEEKTGFKLFNQYPFLREEDTPDEFKILTADSITAYHNYKAKHQELYDKLVAAVEPELTDAEVYEIAASLLKDFELNREIHAELEHYQKNKTILAEHSAFADVKLRREVDAIAPAKLGQAKGNINSNLSKKNKAFAAEKDKAKKVELKTQIDALEAKKKLILARIENAEK